MLLIEDDVDICRLLETDLLEAGYRVSTAGSVMQGLIRAREEQPSLILTDLGLPDGDGRQIIKRLRRDNDVPIIVLTARDNVDDKVELLAAGANDYLVKPFSVPELLARIAVQLRGPITTTLSFGELELDPVTRHVTLAGESIQLRPKEFELLKLLMQKPGRVYSRAEIYQTIWGNPPPPNSNALDVHFANMRARFRNHEIYSLFRTVRGFGFALRA
ncbi:response regulator transcription factor [Deinococcus sp.]|uniref:response regulator transcription factor n=1 Tax=Deinococcus sp. TaxID=47478 RepID=UPI003C7B415D